MIPNRDENPNGFHSKYNISKLNGKPLDPRAEFFILRLDEHSSDQVHILACRNAVLAYADSIAATKPAMALDLYGRYNSHPQTGELLKPEPHI